MIAGSVDIFYDTWETWALPHISSSTLQKMTSRDDVTIQSQFEIFPIYIFPLSYVVNEPRVLYYLYFYGEAFHKLLRYFMFS